MPILESVWTFILVVSYAPGIGGVPWFRGSSSIFEITRKKAEPHHPPSRKEVGALRLNRLVEMHYTHLRAAEASLGTAPRSSGPIRRGGLDSEQLQEAHRKAQESRGKARTPSPEAAAVVREWLPEAVREEDPSLLAMVMPTVQAAATRRSGTAFGASSARTPLSALRGLLDASGICVNAGCPSAPWTAYHGFRAGLCRDRGISSRDPNSNQRHPPHSKRRVPLIYLKGCRGGYRTFS